MQFENPRSKQALHFLLYVLLYLKFNIENAFMSYLHVFHLKIRERESAPGKNKTIKSNRFSRRQFSKMWQNRHLIDVHVSSSFTLRNVLAG